MCEEPRQHCACLPARSSPVTALGPSALCWTATSVQAGCTAAIPSWPTSLKQVRVVHLFVSWAFSDVLKLIFGAKADNVSVCMAPSLMTSGKTWADCLASESAQNLGRLPCLGIRQTSGTDWDWAFRNGNFLRPHACMLRLQTT